jgi:hypothetical protein
MSTAAAGLHPMENACDAGQHKHRENNDKKIPLIASAHSG